MGRSSAKIRYHRMIEAGENPSTKPCAGCERWLRLSEFGADRSRKDGLCNLCRPCARRRQREWVTANHERHRTLAKERARRSRERSPNKAPDAHRKHRYGMEPGDYERMTFEQRGRCVICDRQRRLVVDHSHATGKVRGLLCYSCNIALHLIEGGHLDSALRYLSREDDATAPIAVGPSL